MLGERDPALHQDAQLIGIVALTQETCSRGRLVLARHGRELLQRAVGQIGAEPGRANMLGQDVGVTHGGPTLADGSGHDRSHGPRRDGPLGLDDDRPAGA